jgi:hypothetical protein
MARIQTMNLLNVQFFSRALLIKPAKVQTLSSALYSRTSSVYVLPTMRQTNFRTHTKQMEKLYYVTFDLQHSWMAYSKINGSNIPPILICS